MSYWPDVKIFYYIIIDKIVYNMGQLPCIIWTSKLGTPTSKYFSHKHF